MYHAACKVEFQPFNRSYSQLTFFNFLSNVSIPAEVQYSTALYIYTAVDVVYNVPCLQYRKNNRHIKAQCRYGEHWGTIAFPTCSWRVESGPQQGRFEAVRYSPRAVPTRLGRPACLYHTTLAANSCYYTFLIEPRPVCCYFLSWSANPWGPFL